MLLALQQEIYSFVALFILKDIGKHIEKYRKNTLYSTITTHTKRFFYVLEHAKRAAGHSRQAVRISILHITEISKVLTARLGIQNAQSHLINCFQNSLKSRGQKS